MFVSTNKYIIKIYFMIKLMIHIIYDKYQYIFIYIWSNLKSFDF